MQRTRAKPIRRSLRTLQAAIATVAAIAIFCVCPPANAILLYQSATRNTTAPRNSLANSGWQWEGGWNGDLGTAISKRYFISANHIGGSPGQVFQYNGKDYRTLKEWDDPNSDLRIYEIAGALPDWAPFQKQPDEVGDAAMLFGRGTQRGAAVTVNGTTRGWEWGKLDTVISWGRATISGVAEGTGAGGKSIGDLLEFPFKQPGHGGIEYEGAVSRGDSGGGVFVDDDGHWTLAGVIYATDGPYSLTKNGTMFDASIFDARGLWENGQQIPNSSNPVPTDSYATRISSNVSWIDSVLDGKLVATVSADSPSAARGISADAIHLSAETLTVLPEPQLAAMAMLVLLGSRRVRPITK